MGAGGIVGCGGWDFKGPDGLSGEPKASPAALSSRRRIGYTFTIPHGEWSMPRAQLPPPVISRAAIFGRVGKGEKGMSLALAREIVKLDFTARDRARVHTLSVKNSSGTITPEDALKQAQAETDEWLKQQAATK